MKKNDLLLLFSLTAYSYLFYNQSAGINFLLFNVILLIILFIKNGASKTISNLPWLLSMTGSIATSVCILLYGNLLSVIANIISISLVTVFSSEKNSSIIFAGLHSLYSYMTAVVMMFVDWASVYKKEKENEQQKSLKFFVIAIPILISIIFFFLYRESNTFFKNFTNNINLDFITLAWIKFTLIGFVLLYGFFYQRFIPILAKKDSLAQNNLFAENFFNEKNSLLGFKIEISSELLTGVISFSLLNILLFFVNLLDLQYVWLAKSVPDGLSLSDSVHQGIGTLITSIIFAVLIILIYFRGNINFYSSSKTIKILAYLWIIQNIFMILSTVIKNQLYINEYSLTYKRIGVYVYLLLCLIGLFTTIIKIASAKSNWYLFRSNGWLFYGILIISCVINWDRMITKFNLSNSKTLDHQYLLSLSPANIDLLLANPEINNESMATATYEITPVNSHSNNRFVHNPLYYMTFDFLKTYQEEGWQSWNKRDDTINSNILVIADTIFFMGLASNHISSLQPLEKFKKIKKLDLAYNNFKALNELENFSLLDELNLTGNGIDSLQRIPVLKNIISLTLNENSIKNLYPLKNLQRLEYLNLSRNQIDSLGDLPALPNLKLIDLSHNTNIIDFSPLERLPNLEVLNIAGCTTKDIETLYNLKKLKIIYYDEGLNQTDIDLLKLHIPSLESVEKVTPEVL